MKQRSFLGTVVIVWSFSTAMAAAQAASWTPIGPQGVQDAYRAEELNAGRVSTLVVVNSTMLIGTAGGGIWRYDSDTRRWTNPRTKHALAFGSTAIAPSNPAIIYAGSGEAHGCGDCYASRGLLRSVDGGQTWSLLRTSGVADNTYSPVNFTSAIAVDPRNAGHLWIGGDTGLWEGREGRSGWNWTQRRTCPSSRNQSYACVTSVVLDPNDPAVVYVGDRDGIESFTTGAGGGVTRQVVDLAGPGLSLDPATYGPFDVALATARVPARRFYATISSRSTDFAGCLVAVLRSDDGVAWRTVDATLDNQLDGALHDYFWPDYAYGKIQPGTSCTKGQAEYDDAIAVNPNNADDVAVGGINVLRSLNGGATWLDLSMKYTLHPDVHGLAFSHDALFVATDGGVDEISPGDTARVSRLGAGLPIMEFYEGGRAFGSKESIVVGAQDNGTNVLSTSISDDSAPAAWKNVFGGDGGYADVDPLNPAVMYVEEQGGWLAVVRGNDPNDSSYVAKAITQQGPEFWWPHAAWVMPFRVSPTNDRRTLTTERLYVGADEVWRSSDTGRTWSRVTAVRGGDGVNVQSMDVAKLPDGSSDAILSGWTGTYNDKTISFLEASYDGGAHWSHLTPALKGGFIADVYLDRQDLRRAYVALNSLVDGDAVHRGGRIVEIPDANRDAIPSSGIDLTHGLGCTPLTVREFNGRLFVGCDDGVYDLDEASQTWQRFGEDLPFVAVYDLIPVKGGLVAVTHGRGLWHISVDFQ